MILVQPSIEVVTEDVERTKKILEWAGRKCYRSEARITPTSAGPFISNLVERHHVSVIEHRVFTVCMTVDRAIAQEITRHRIGSYSHESTRYINYTKSLGGEISFIDSSWLMKNDAEAILEWMSHLEACESQYFRQCELVAPEVARDVLPLDLASDLVITYNLRSWMHFFMMRCGKEAHPKIRQVAIPLLLYFKSILPEIFSKIDFDHDFPCEYYAQVREVLELAA